MGGVDGAEGRGDGGGEPEGGGNEGESDDAARGFESGGWKGDEE